MPLDSRKVAHIEANRVKIRAQRTETVVLVSTVAGVVTYTAQANCIFYQAGAVPAGISNRVGEITRTPYDGLLELPDGSAWPSGTYSVARTATASQAGVMAATERYQVLDRRPIGLGTVGDGGGANYGNRFVVRLRLRR
jgi:hypothetical protein